LKGPYSAWSFHFSNFEIALDTTLAGAIRATRFRASLLDGFPVQEIISARKHLDTVSSLQGLNPPAEESA
jgi:hypothetical protein